MLLMQNVLNDVESLTCLNFCFLDNDNAVVAVNALNTPTQSDNVFEFLNALNFGFLDVDNAV